MLSALTPTYLPILCAILGHLALVADFHQPKHLEQLTAHCVRMLLKFLEFPGHWLVPFPPLYYIGGDYVSFSTTILPMAFHPDTHHLGNKGMLQKPTLYHHRI